MMLFPLQAQTIPESLSPDSLAAKREIVVETLRNTPPDQLLEGLLQQAIQFGLKLLAALLIYAVGAWLIKLVRSAVRKHFQLRKAEPTLITFTDSLVSISLWVLLIVISISTLGINTTSMAALLAAGGMAVGMALSGTVQNFAGGLMILIFKPFKVGDFIEAQGFTGMVTEVTIVSTRILTTDNRAIVLPNGALSNGIINNVNREPLRRVDLTLSLPYGTDSEKAREAILEIIRSNELFLNAETPGAADPFVALHTLADSSINYVIRCWVRTPDYWTAYFWLNENLYTLLPQRYGIHFPFPQMDIHIKH